jgi:xylulose-5-phosphate/fructose-6-phosphate phosphoketolase
MVVLNQLDRYSLALDAIEHVPRLHPVVAETRQRFSEIMERHKLYVTEHGEDMPEVSEWKWSPR